MSFITALENIKYLWKNVTKYFIDIKIGGIASIIWINNAKVKIIYMTPFILSFK